jgi:peptide deformylase
MTVAAVNIGVQQEVFVVSKNRTKVVDETVLVNPNESL